MRDARVRQLLHQQPFHGPQLKRSHALALVVTTLACAPAGFLSILSVYHAYDDEGYFLITLRNFLNGHADYAQIYGPFYYQVMAVVSRAFSLDVSSDNGRLITLTIWLLASLISGITVLTLTRSLWLGVAGQLLTFHMLSALVNEPMHPSGLIALLLVSLAVVAANRSRFERTSAVLVGALVAAITLVKINVGAYAALAVAFAFAATLPARWRRVALPAIGMALVAAPLVVTSGLFGLEWVRELALMVSFSAAAVVVAALAGEATIVRRGDFPGLIAGGASVLAISLGIAAAGGLRLSDVVNSVVSAARFPGLFLVPAEVGIYGVMWAVLCLAAAGGIAWRKSWPRLSPVVPALLRMAAGAFTLGSLLILPWPLFPLAWVAVLRPAGAHDRSADPHARVLLATLAVMESLQVYPVGGTQKWIAALLVVPVGAIIFNDGLRQFQTWAASRQSRSVAMVAAWLAPAALIVNIPFALLFGYLAASAYASGQPLGLRGTELMRLPPAQASALQAVAKAVDQNCTSLITLPRMSSWNIWTGLPGNSRLETGDGIWIFSLDALQQESIVAQIRDKSGLCVVRNQAVIDFLSGERPVPRRPLVEFIDTAFTSVAKFGDYELLIRT